MKSWARLGTAVAVLFLLLAGQAATAANDLAISVDRATIEAPLGHTFSFHTTIANHSDAPAAGLIAHLNVLSLRGDVYVDPEDWSSHRTRYLPSIPAGGSTTLTWKLNAVNAGRLGAYIAVLPRTGADPPATSPTIRIAIADRRTLNSGGIFPLAVGIPALIGLLAVSLRLRRRRTHEAPTTR